MLRMHFLFSKYPYVIIQRQFKRQRNCNYEADGTECCNILVLFVSYNNSFSFIPFLVSLVKTNL